MSDRVWMVHPDLPEARISCRPSGVGVRQMSGWQVEQPPQNDEPEQEPEPEPEAPAAARRRHSASTEKE